MDAAQYKCPNCNSELTFDPVNQTLSCAYCMSKFTIDEIKAVYADTETVLHEETPEPDEFTEHTALYHCGSCGADIMADDRQTATFCYYCHNPVILSGKLTGDFKPSKIIPFKLDRDIAVQRFKSWCWNRAFVPRDFKTQEQIEKMTGLYVPFWVADCETKADLSAIGNKVRSWRSGDYEYTETKEFAVSRMALINLQGIPADGESKIEDELMEAIEPFDYKELKDFNMSYFSGFYADKYDVDKKAVFPRIRQRVETVCKKVLHDSISGYTSTRISNEQYNIQKTDWQYMMLPVWFMTYKYNDEIYEFAVNGQTGKVAGTPPLDKRRLKLLCLGIAAVITLLFYIGGTYLL